MTRAGFDIPAGEHPIVPIMLYDERLAHDMARRLLEEGIYVIGFSYPVVPRGKARIRVQLSAAHEPAHLERAVAGLHPYRAGAWRPGRGRPPLSRPAVQNATTPGSPRAA